MATFGERFKKFRKKKGYTQEELVTEFNKIYHHTLGKSAISQYENNKRIPEINVLIDFADYFNVSIDYLLGVSNIPNHDCIREQKLSYGFISTSSKIDLEEFLMALIEEITVHKEITLDGKPISPEAMSLFTDIVDLGIQLAKRRNKSR